MIRRFLTAFLLLLPALAAWGAIEVFPSTPQGALVGQEFAPLRVRVTDERGEPASGATVAFQLPWAYNGFGLLFAQPPQASGWACLSDLGVLCRGTTDSQGEATLPALYSSVPGTFTVTLSATSRSGTSLGS